MALNVRRLVARFVIMTAVTLAVVTVVSKLEGKGGGPRDVEIVVDLDAVPGVRSVEIELRRGKQVVAHTERNVEDGLGGPVRLRGPAVKDGEVRVMIDTEAGLRRIRRPLTAAGGSEVVIRAGIEEEPAP